MSLIQDFKENVADISDRAKRFFTPLSAEEKLEKAKTLLATIPEGKELLTLAEQLDCPILSRHLPKACGTYIKYASGRHAVFIRPHFPLQRLTSTLAHELRHMWQFHHMPELSINIRDSLFSTASSLAITRVIEGDAVSFEKNVMAKINGKNGDAHEAVFHSFQTSLNASLYDVLALSKKRLKAAQLKTVFNDHAFDHVPDLRKILVPGLDIQATPYITAENTSILLSDILKIAERQKIKRIIVSSLLR